jgi:2-deoxy-D-gluconate 3-dehydrogenase
MPEIAGLFDLRGRVAAVTGGAGLLGCEFCRTLAEAGAAVVVGDLNAGAASALAGSLVQAGYSALGVEVDVTSPVSARRMVDEAVDGFGRLDILVNSAALDPKFDPQHVGSRHLGPQHGEQPTASSMLENSFEEYPLELWDQALSVNLTGMFLCCQAAVRPMLAQGKGAIINICSTYGLVGPDQRIYERPGEPTRYKPVFYSVTKAGVLGLTRYLATYYAGKDIRVNALTPGGVFNNHDETFLKAYSARTVLGRMAHRHEMNGALLFLASDASSYMTGSNLVVDGGWTAW